jgi:hypothetical protein
MADLVDEGHWWGRWVMESGGGIRDVMPLQVSQGQTDKERICSSRVVHRQLQNIQRKKEANADICTHSASLVFLLSGSSPCE